METLIKNYCVIHDIKEEDYNKINRELLPSIFIQEYTVEIKDIKKLCTKIAMFLNINNICGFYQNNIGIDTVLKIKRMKLETFIIGIILGSQHRGTKIY